MNSPEFWQPHLSALARRVIDDTGFSVRICAEIEAYVDGLEMLNNADALWNAIIEQSSAQELTLESIAKESDRANPSHQVQYEFRFSATDPLTAVRHVSALKEIAQNQAKALGGSIAFDAWREGAPSCGLHWHVHLLNDKGDYCFFKQEEKLTPPLEYSLGGLLATMQDAQLCFAQSDAAYQRLFQAPDHVPQTISWGGNNRTVALRMPESVVPHRHIEHRLCAADGNIAASVWAIVMGLHYGLTNKLSPQSEQIFGNASDATHNLPRLKTHRSDAKEAFASSEVIAGYMDVNQALAHLA